MSLVFNPSEARLQGDTASRFMGGVNQLMAMKQGSYNQALENLGKWGQAKRAEGLAEAIASGDLNGMEPAELAMAAAALTGGNSLGEGGKQALDMLMMQAASPNDLAMTGSSGRMNSSSSSKSRRRGGGSKSGSTTSALGLPESANTDARQAYINTMMTSNDPAYRNKLYAEGVMNGIFKEKDKYALRDSGLVGKIAAKNTRRTSSTRSKSSSKSSSIFTKNQKSKQPPSVRKLMDFVPGAISIDDKNRAIFKGRVLDEPSAREALMDLGLK